MLAVSLTTVDSVPTKNGLNYDLNQWLEVTVDVLNQDFSALQNLLNIFTVSSYTSTEIAGLTLTNGVILYDSTLDVYVGKAAGALVKFTTTPYP